MVRDAQHVIIFNYLDQLIEQNEVISDKTRQVFWDAIEIGLLGVERDFSFVVHFNGGTYNLGPLSEWARRLSFLNDTKDKTQEIELKGKKQRLPNRFLWEQLRENLYNPMAKALQVSLQSSAEIMTREGGVFEFNPEQRIKPTTPPK